jgi:hypothetical protein
MAIKATLFRAQMFKVLAGVLSDGKAVEIELSGRLLELRPKLQSGTKLGALVQRSVVTDRDDDLLSAGWDMEAWERNWDELLGKEPIVLAAKAVRGRTKPKPRPRQPKGRRA